MAVLFGEVALVAGAAFADGVACAEWATAVLVAGARIDDGLPGVAVFALPPNFAPAAGEDIVGSERRIFGWVPFGGYVRIFCGKIIEAWEHLGIGAVWAAAVTLGAAGDGSLILVAFVADPPDFFVAGGSDSLWCEVAILGWMPLAGDIWIPSGKVGLAGNGPTTVTIRAARATAAARIYSSLPAVSIRAVPPNIPFTAIAHAFWGERQVALAVPLVKQFFAACEATEIGERFAHIDHLLKIKKQRDPQL